jgi:dTDP-4-dehydrorhamnose 3,5-epimerase
MSASRVTLITPKRFADERGWFCESFSARGFADAIGAVDFVQDNHSYSCAAGTLRGLHFQKPPHAQAKLVRCVRGVIWDVAVDLRRGSPTYGRHVAAELSAENGRQLFIPTGFAHAFVTLTADAEVLYKASDFYAPAHDAGLAWNDPDLAIPWPLADQRPILSPKDAALPLLKDFVSPFTYEGFPLALVEA